MEPKLKLHIYVILFIALVFTLAGCDKDDDFGEQNNNTDDYTHEPGLFIINEGNFGQGNGSVSFYNPGTKKIHNDIFYSTNDRPLGDVPFDIEFTKEKAIISVNNAAKAEIVNLNDFTVSRTITELGSPREIEIIHENQIYISDLESPEMDILDLDEPSNVQTIHTGKSTEAMLYNGQYLFVTNWSEFYVNSPNNSVMVIDPQSNSLVKTIQVAKEPNSLAEDKNGDIWILSSGGFNNSEYPALSRIDPVQLSLEEEIRFDDKNQSPSNLCINKSGDSLFFLNKDIYALSQNDTMIPQKAYFKAGKRNLNSMVLDHASQDVYFSNALDYQQKGWILRYDRDQKALTDSFRVGIVPGRMKFYRPE